MKNKSINWIFTLITVVLLITIFSIRNIGRGDIITSKHAMYTSEGKLFSSIITHNNAVSNKSESPKTVVTENDIKNASVVSTVAVSQVSKKGGEQIISTTISPSEPNAREGISQAITASKSAAFSNQQNAYATGVAADYKPISAGNTDMASNVSASSVISNNGMQKGKPNGPGAEPTLPIGNGVWILLMLVSVYGVTKKMF